MTLNPTQTMTLQVQFQPTVTGTASGQITISSNSSTGSTAQVTLSGTSTAAPSPQLTVSAASLELWQCDGEYGDDAVIDADIDRDVSGDGELCCDHWSWLHDRWEQFSGDTEPDAIGDVAGSVRSDSNWDSQRADHDQQQFDYRWHGLVTLGGTGTAANPQLTVSAASLSFGSVTVNTATTQSLTLTSTGTTPVTVNSAAITGAGFTIVGGSFPVTLNPTQTLTLQLQFEPTTAGALTGQITINSNSTTGSTAVSLSGTGTAVAHEVDLSWDAPASSPDPVAGYNIYRATGSGSLVLINSSPDSAVVYVDSTVVSGTTYSYVVKSVDSSGVESVASNEITVTIP